MTLKWVFGPATALAAGVTLLLSHAAVSAAEPPGQSAVKWLIGPETAHLQDVAQIKVPPGYKFADGETTRRLLRSGGEPTSGREMGLLMPADGVWSVFFQFSDDGYVNDNDKDKLNADKLLKAIIKGNDRANEERKRMGSPALKITGWEAKPHYDLDSHNLQWAIRAESEGRAIVNFNTRLLGRRGVMEVILVCEPGLLSEVLPTFKGLLADYAYKEGERYAEYRPGDKVAQYGLAALITGGAVAVAAKTGLLASLALLCKKMWKLLILVGVGVVALLKKLITGRSEPKALE
jgi:uncharacterized membrane-anchored protein